MMFGDIGGFQDSGKECLEGGKYRRRIPIYALASFIDRERDRRRRWRRIPLFFWIGAFEASTYRISLVSSIL